VFERNSSQTSTVTYYCKIECKFNGNTFEGEAGHKNILIKTNASKKNEAKTLAAEKALQPYDQVDASVNIQTTKKIKTPLGIAIYFNNIIFIEFIDNALARFVEKLMPKENGLEEARNLLRH
jgi:hypothetical protein